MTDYAYYPGCSLKSSACEYDDSFRYVADAFGIGLEEIEDWNCCGASPAPHHWVESLGVLLPARNIHLAGASHEAMVAPCVGCYNRLKYSQHELNRSEEVRKQTSQILGEEVRYRTEVLNIVQLLNREIDAEDLAERAGERFKDIKIGTYYGCLLNKPADVIQYDDPRNPRKMEPLLEAVGAQVPYFALKTECCGSYMGLPRKEIVLSASRKILEVAMDSDMDMLVTACPLCHQNLDLRQAQINHAYRTSIRMPVLYFSQVIALAIGATPERAGLDSLAVSADPILSKMEAA